MLRTRLPSVRILALHFRRRLVNVCYFVVISKFAVPLQDFETWEWKRLEGDFRCARTIIISDNENPLDEMQQPVQEKLWRQVHKMLQ